MGYEYKISFHVADPVELSEFLAGLPGQSDTTPDYSVALERDGFYFCDYAKSDLSSKVFRRLIDKGLNQSDVIISEL